MVVTGQQKNGGDPAQKKNGLGGGGTKNICGGDPSHDPDKSTKSGGR